MEPALRTLVGRIKADARRGKIDVLIQNLASDAQCTLGVENCSAALRGEDGGATTARKVLRVLEIGGAPEDLNGETYYVYPYFVYRYIDDDARLESVMIIGRDVNCRAKPRLETESIARYSYDLVHLLKLTEERTTIAGEAFPWAQIRSADGVECYIWAKYIYSTWDFRLMFQKRNGKWQVRVAIESD